MFTLYRPAYYDNPRASSFVGLSTDEKSLDEKNGASFEEIDTGKVFRFDEENKVWHEEVKRGGGTSVYPYNNNPEALGQEANPGTSDNYSRGDHVHPLPSVSELGALPVGNIANEFSTSSTYAVGDYVIYEGQLYQCTTAVTTAGSWNSSNWTQAVLGNEVGELKSALNAFHVIHVNANGTGDYTTIADAVAAASDNDTIVVHPGVYTESVHAFAKKVHIKGVDRDTCILQYSGLDYANPPLEMAKGSVENLTINCFNSGTQGKNPAYCVHIDNNNAENQTLLFKNVRFYNPVHQGVGIGLRHNFELSFLNCEFEAYHQAALYCHDWETSSTSADKTGQKLVCKDCTFYNNDANRATIMMQSQELATNCAECTFVGCSVYNANPSGSKISMKLWAGRTLTNNSFMGSSDWILNSISGLNTVRELNNNLYPVKGTEVFDLGLTGYFDFNSSKSLTLNIPKNFGALCCCMLQGVGFVVLSVFHRTTNEVVVTDLATKQSFSSPFVTISAPNEATVKFESTVASKSFISVVAPQSITVTV